MRFVAAVLVGAVVALGAAVPAGAAPTEVVGGQRAPEGKFPWVVRLSVGCDGALVASRVVLTAGHCVSGTGRTTRIAVTAGSVDLGSPRAVTVHSVYVRRAAGFHGATGGHDWAVIQLDRALDLPTLALTPSGAYDQGQFTIMGWGATSENGAQQRYLRYATVDYVADRSCRQAYGRAFVATDMICAGDLAHGGVDTCQGDSGGPMVRPDAHGTWVEVGIVSFGNGCARAGYPGVYTRVSAFTRDIADAVAGLERT
jgi:secreted trypsin-like serine protease